MTTLHNPFVSKEILYDDWKSFTFTIKNNEKLFPTKSKKHHKFIEDMYSDTLLHNLKS